MSSEENSYGYPVAGRPSLGEFHARRFPICRDPLRRAQGIASLGNYIQEDPNGQRTGDGVQVRGDIGVRFDPSKGSGHRRLNEPRDGKVSEPVVP